MFQEVKYIAPRKRRDPSPLRSMTQHPGERSLTFPFPFFVPSSTPPPTPQKEPPLFSGMEAAAALGVKNRGSGGLVGRHFLPPPPPINEKKAPPRHTTFPSLHIRKRGFPPHAAVRPQPRPLGGKRVFCSSSSSFLLSMAAAAEAEAEKEEA